MIPIVLCGAGNHAVVLHEVLHEFTEYRVCAIAVEQAFQDGVRPELSSYTRIPVENATDLSGCQARHAVIAIGNNAARHRLGLTFQKLGFFLPNVLHPSAIISPSCRMGAGNVFLAGSVMGVRTRVADFVIVNTRASVDHDCELQSGVHVCPGATLAGGVRVGEKTWVGVGSTISDDLTVGHDCLVGAGSVVVRDLPDGVVAYGVPARPIRPNR